MFVSLFIIFHHFTFLHYPIVSNPEVHVYTDDQLFWRLLVADFSSFELDLMQCGYLASIKLTNTREKR